MNSARRSATKPSTPRSGAPHERGSGSIASAPGFMGTIYNARVSRLVQCSVAADRSFRPRSGAETLRVAELARPAGDRSTAQALLIGFVEHFPGDMALAEARDHG